MRPSDLLWYAYKALTERRLRAALTIIGIAIGPLALVMMTSVVRGYSNFIQESILGLGQNTIAVFPNADYRLGEEDLRFFESIDGVREVSPFYLTQGILRTPEGELKVNIYAADLNVLLSSIGGIEIQEGRLPLPSEVTYAAVGYYIVHSEASGKRIYDVGDVITLILPEVKGGGQVTFRRVSVRIKGFFEEYGGALIISPDKAVFLPYGAGRKLLGLNTWSGILVIAEEPEYVDSIVATIRETYRDRLEVFAFQQIARSVGSVTAAVDLITFSTSLAAFAVAVAGTAATMITSVIERTREIGVLKALGFTNRQVTIMVLAESMLMSLIGALIGMSAGVVGAYLLSSRGLTIRGAGESIVISATPEITVSLILQTLAITIFVGVMGGVFPAYRAAKIPPAVALRYE